MTTGRSKNKISQMIETSLASKQKKPTFFAFIATKLVDIVFDKTIDNIKEVNQKYTTP